MKVFRSERIKIKIFNTYHKLLSMWNVDITERDIETHFGKTHIIECGNKQKPPLLLFHGVGDNSALMWVYNAKALSEFFHIYAVDTIGGPGKSIPNNNYQKEYDEIKWVDEIINNLSLHKTYMAGVSNGSYITQLYGIMRPEKVIKMVCMAGSVSVKGNVHPMKTMMKVFLPEAIVPTKRNIVRLIKKLSGEHSDVFINNPIIMEHYTYLLRGFNTMAMGYHPIEFFQEEQIKNLAGKSLFLIGDSDPIVNSLQEKEKLEKFNLEYKIYKGVGHGINHEISDEINHRIIEYFYN